VNRKISAADYSQGVSEMAIPTKTTKTVTGFRERTADAYDIIAWDTSQRCCAPYFKHTRVYQKVSEHTRVHQKVSGLALICTTEGTKEIIINTVRTSQYMQSVPGGYVNILGGHSIGHSKQKCIIHVPCSERIPR
jgi:hypothetical protein